MKKRILLATMAVMMLGLTACGGDKKNDESATVSGNAEVTTEAEEGKEDSAKEDSSFSGDWNAVEEAGYKPFWLKYGPKALEKKDLSSVELYGCFTDGTNVKDIIYNPKFTYYEIITGYYDDIETDNLAEAIANDTNTFGDGWVCDINLYEQKDGDCITVQIYSLASEAQTIAQCIEGNEYKIGDANQMSVNNTSDVALGIPYGEKCDINTCIQVGELLGKPDKIYEAYRNLMLIDRDAEEETYAETVQRGGGFIGYIMMYKMNRGMLFVNVGEANFSEKYASAEGDMTYIQAEYCSSEDLYIYLRDETNSGAIVQEDEEYAFE